MQTPVHCHTKLVLSPIRDIRLMELVIQWVTLSFRITKVLHQTLNPTAELWCKTFSRIKVDLVLHRTVALEVFRRLHI